jgi:hypothetical protein
MLYLPEFPVYRGFINIKFLLLFIVIQEVRIFRLESIKKEQKKVWQNEKGPYICSRFKSEVH